MRQLLGLLGCAVGAGSGAGCVGGDMGRVANAVRDADTMRLGQVQTLSIRRQAVIAGAGVGLV